MARRRRDDFRQSALTPSSKPLKAGAICGPRRCGDDSFNGLTDGFQCRIAERLFGVFAQVRIWPAGSTVSVGVIVSAHNIYGRACLVVMDTQTQFCCLTHAKQLVANSIFANDAGTRAPGADRENNGAAAMIVLARASRASPNCVLARSEVAPLV